MKDAQLERMTVRELRELRERIEEAIRTATVRDRAELRAKMAALAEEHGLSLQEILGGSKGKTRAPTAITYRNPKNPDETWTGRGRKPKWLAEAGGNIERFRVA